MGNEAVAVLDIGKTNKKVSLFSRDFEVLAAERASIPPRDHNGIEVEDTPSILSWFKQNLASLSRHAAIRGIAVTTHGATFVLLDETGALAHPVISYTWPGGSVIQDEFYETFGSPLELHRRTGTPDIGFVNMAKVLFYVKTRMPEVWTRCRHGLFYGPYFGYELTGVRGLEPTFPGNHTYFWDFTKTSWSSVGRALEADRLFGERLQKSWDVLGPIRPEWAQETGVPADCQVTLGIHDSNANYLPYLAQEHTDFLLNSTGTWCVLMRPSNTVHLTDAEIEAKVFFNQDAFARPVRTSLTTSGMDYDAYREFTDAKDEGDLDAARRVIRERSLFVVPGVLPDARAFPGETPRVVRGDKVYPLDDLRRDGGKPFSELGQDYYAALDLGLALATKRMLGHCGIGSETTVFIEGGFAKNRTYCQALAALCPTQKFRLTRAREGTSFGAALTGWMAADGLSLEEAGRRFTIESDPVVAEDLGDVTAYEAAFDRKLAETGAGSRV